MSIDVLLSGFDPFAGAATNESWESVRRAAPLLEARGLSVGTVRLPVVFSRGADLLLEQVAARSPRLVIATGLAAGRRAITPERVAINVQDARIADNDGRSPIDAPCVDGGPVGYFSTLPIKAMVESARELDVPAAVSQSAGTYVCNDVFYRLCHALQADASEAGDRGVAVRGGFVHVPSADVVGAEDAARALVGMIEAALRSDQDLRITGGVES
ncbi:pyroglutamyl-peptidase I [Brachybacterium sp. MASK1Z-5]|uniref:Pyroglutamyl-peptidase I n=1 Tax=Brachybacterium halotolerans TaxID=2795215 RepID=A0ABS1BCK1_9MICO|nr:pyroglutamyl-peptidase I [Brachybacterium halotolerans]MBK0331735.1 pyroglutamyl-peptidase I [Brachybacterium halotolerans]